MGEVWLFPIGLSSIPQKWYIGCRMRPGFACAGPQHARGTPEQVDDPVRPGLLPLRPQQSPIAHARQHLFHLPVQRFGPVDDQVRARRGRPYIPDA